MSKSSYLKIANDLVMDILKGKFKPNDKMPSEAQLTIKYNVSRIVASNAFSELLKVGAVHSIPKKGYFVSENFSGMIKPISFQYGIDRIETSIINLGRPEIFKTKRISGDYVSGVRKYYKNNELIIISNFFISNRIDIKANESLTNIILKNKEKVKSTTFLKFENFEAFNKSKNLVNTRLIYADGNIPLIEKYVVQEDYFELVKQEFSL